MNDSKGDVSMVERQVLYLKFATPSGKESLVTVAHPKAGLTLADVTKVASVITDKQALESANKEPLVSFKKAYIVTTTTQELV